MSSTEENGETENCSPQKRLKLNPLETEVNMILELYKSEMKANPKVDVEEVIKKVANLAGVWCSTVYSVINEYRQSKENSIPKTNQNLTNNYQLIDDSVKNAVRRKVHEFFLRNTLPTIDVVLKAVNDDCVLPNFQRAIFCKLLKLLRLKQEYYVKTKIILDTDEMVVWRRGFLRKLNFYRRQKRKIYYLDEMWIYKSNVRSKIIYNKTAGCSKLIFSSGFSDTSKSIKGRGTTHIICHIGSYEGFVPDALWAFETQLSECHKETVAQSFEEWFKEILPNLEDRAVIVVDNAPCHTRRIENIPSYTSTKSEIQSWLSSKNIHFESDSLKVELLDIVNKNKEPYNKYVIDELAREDNKIVMRIPPYHDELNPFSLIWEEVKNYVTSKTSTFEVPDVLNLLHEAVSRIGKESWENSIKHVREKVEKEMWDLDNILESFIEPLIIKLKNENEYDSCSE